jgi:hypothetical protein
MRPYLGPEADWTRRKCHRCGGVKTLDHYSLQERRDANADWFCNLCRIDSSKYLFLKALADRPDFMSHPYRGCSPKALAEEGVSPEVFFPDTPQSLAEGRWRPLCGPCPVKAKCAAYGAQTGSVGVWGGEFRGGLDAGVYQPGKNLLKAGRCKHGHEIKSLADVRIHRDRYGRIFGGCQKCDDEYQVSRRKKVVGAAV